MDGKAMIGAYLDYLIVLRWPRIPSHGETICVVTTE